VANKCASLKDRSGNSRERRSVDVVVRYAGSLEGRGDRGNWTVGGIPLGASAGKRMKIGGKEACFRDTAASGFMAAVVDYGLCKRSQQWIE
jgi:hypothetical protein